MIRRDLITLWQEMSACRLFDEFERNMQLRINSVLICFGRKSALLLLMKLLLLGILFVKKNKFVIKVFFNRCDANKLGELLKMKIALEKLRFVVDNSFLSSIFLNNAICKLVNT